MPSQKYCVYVLYRVDQKIYVVTMSKLRNPRDNLSWPGEDREAAKHKEPGAEHPCGQEQQL